MMELILAIPVEYLIAALMLLLVYLSVRYHEKKFINIIAFPLAVIFLISSEIYNLLKGLQIKIVKDRAIHGSRYEVMAIFLVIFLLGIVTAILAKICLFLTKVNPLLYPLSVVFSAVSKYFNLILLPEVIQNGNDKLQSFKLFNWCYKQVAYYWNWFKEKPIYTKLVKIMADIKSAVLGKINNLKASFVASFPQIMEFIKGMKQKKGLIKKVRTTISAKIKAFKARKA